MLPNIHVTSKIPSTQLMTKLCHNKKDYVEWSVLQNNKVSLVLDAPLWRNNKQREMEQNSEPKLRAIFAQRGTRRVVAQVFTGS